MMEREADRAYCIEYVEKGGQKLCTKLIRLRVAGEAVFVELVKRDPGSGEEVVEELAHLPREIYLVSEPHFGEFFAAYESNKLIAASRGWNDLLRKLEARGYYVGRSKYMRASKMLIPRIEKTVSAGLSEDGEIIDPLDVLDKTDYGAEPLRAAYELITSAYTGRNAEYAWYNVIVALTHVATSPLRTPRKNRFLDYVVYNVVPHGYGAVMYVLEKMLSGRRGCDDYVSVIYEEPLRAGLGGRRLAAMLLDLNRLPLVLVGQTKKTLKRFEYVLESAGGGFVALDRRGEKQVPNLRGIIIFADDLYDIPAPRRLTLRWDLPTTRQTQIKPPPIKPIYGFAARLWRKHRDRFTASALPYLVASVAEATAQEISGEAEEVAEFTRRIAKLTDLL